MRLFGAAQGKKIVILDSDPALCGKILAASATKGTFLEQLFSTPAWHPIYSIESVDGALWKQLSHDFAKVMNQLRWPERVRPLIEKHCASLPQLIDAETISRLVLRILFALLFEHEISKDDETLYYQASMEWRKEVAILGKADSRIKEAFWQRLTAQVAASRFKEGLESYRSDPSSWLSVFAQPFLLSPQINISDIFVAVFDFLKADTILLARARGWAEANDNARLEGIVLEALRLRHPFPVLEREIPRDLVLQGKRYAAGTHFFILLDRFKQDQTFDPERWLQTKGENPYAAIPFSAGPRMCIGKPIAMELLRELLKNFLLAYPIEALQPQRGHRYSGRNNDGQESLAESWYQLRTFARNFRESLRLRRK
jgi:hypothetical protein